MLQRGVLRVVSTRRVAPRPARKATAVASVASTKWRSYADQAGTPPGLSESNFPFPKYIML
jgi:hypothetical protein